MTLRVLIVDDEDSILFAVGDYFSNLGYAVNTASEREEAEALLKMNEYDLIIADLRLAGVNEVAGLEIIRFAREQSSDTKIILMTAYGSPEVEKEARALGVHCFIQKPKPLADLAQIASGLLEGE
jgi:CheY-like chemotaxis protein